MWLILLFTLGLFNTIIITSQTVRPGFDQDYAFKNGADPLTGLS
jgi:hypothetical protein